MRVKFLVTPVGLMMGNIESARRMKNALALQGTDVTDDPDDQNFEILHVHTPVPPSNIRIVKRAKSRGIPVVMHAHTTAEDSEGTWIGSEALSGITGRYLTMFYNLGDLVLAPSHWTKRTLEARGVTTPVSVLSNGVDLGRFAFDPARREKFRARYGIPEDAVLAYSIGVVCLKKGVETFAPVSKAVPHIKFAWIGRQSLLYHPMRVSRAIRRCGENAQFMHDVEDIVDAHCGGDIFFTPSFTENQGMAVMEAMAVGKPVVARDLPSYEGLLVHDRTAMICSDEKDFEVALDTLAKDRTKAEALVREGRTAIASHDLGRVAQELRGIYESLLEGRGREIGAIA